MVVTTSGRGQPQILARLFTARNRSVRCNSAQRITCSPATGACVSRARKEARLARRARAMRHASLSESGKFPQGIYLAISANAFPVAVVATRRRSLPVHVSSILSTWSRLCRSAERMDLIGLQWQPSRSLLQVRLSQRQGSGSQMMITQHITKIKLNSLTQRWG